MIAVKCSAAAVIARLSLGPVLLSSQTVNFL